MSKVADHTHRLPVAALFAVALLSWLVFFFAPTWQRRVIRDIDEYYSLLSATGHLGEYKAMRDSETFPIGEWVPASEWQRFLQLENGRGLQSVTQDLLYWDIHPPLYFWLLHGWLHLFSANHWWVGALLNWIIALATAFILFHLARRIFDDRSYAVLVVMVWLLSPLFLRMAYSMRQYVLLTFWTVLLTWLLFRILENPSIKKRLIYFSGAVTVSVAGLLTQYVFAFIVIAVSLVGIRSHRARHSRYFWMTVVPFSLLSLTLIVVLVTNDTFGALSFVTGRLNALTIVWQRLPKLLLTFFYLCLPVLAALVLVGMTRLLRRFTAIDLGEGSRSFVITPGNRNTVVRLAMLTLIPFTFMAVFYIIGIFPSQVMSSQYVMFLTPSIALLAVMPLVHLKGNRMMFSLMILVMILLGAFTSLRAFNIAADNVRLNLDPAQNSSLLMFDRGRYPALFSQFDADKIIFAAEPSHLLENTEAWLPRLAAEGGVYVSYVVNNPGNLEKRYMILSRIAENACYDKLSEYNIDKDSIAIFRVWAPVSGSCLGNE